MLEKYYIGKLEETRRESEQETIKTMVQFEVLHREHKEMVEESKQLNTELKDLLDSI